MTAIADATMWIVRLLLGTVGTSVAVIAVAVVGLLLLRGRLPLARATTVILGCFILFGAPVIATGILSVVADEEEVASPSPATVPAPAYTPTTPAPTLYDPYAGASVPTREARSGSDIS